MSSQRMSAGGGGGSADEAAGGGDDLMERMVIAERRALAQQLGVRVSDLEEALALSKAMADSAPAASVSATDEPAAPAAAPAAKTKDDEQEEEEEDDEPSQTFSQPQLQLQPQLQPESEQEQATDKSRWFWLPQELADRVLVLLCCPDSLGYLSMVAKQNPFRPSEHVYKETALHIYPRQFGPRGLRLQVGNWGNSWRTLLVHRPRLRTNGFYTLKTLFTKAACQESIGFDEPKVTGSLETAYYRHFRFFDDGRVLYSPSLVDPWDMAPRLRRARRVDKQIFLGSYSARGRSVQCSFALHYCEVRFELLVLDGCESYSNYPGNHSVLRIVAHSQLLPGPGAAGAGGGEARFPLPVNCDCRFWRDWPMAADQPIS